MTSDLALLRKGLWPLSMVYGLGVALRNAGFDRGLRAVHRVPVPVISVGNLAAGGTGKTPLVVWLVQSALAAGQRPGVLARGYRRAAGDALNDEGKLLARRIPDLSQVQDPDRVRGARRLIEEMRVDVIILDDGFQHRRLHRDLDLVCVDTAQPLAGGLLPIGLLREGPKALRRADGLILTRAGAFTTEAVQERADSLRKFCASDTRIFASDHVATRVVAMPDKTSLAPADLHGRRTYLLSAIARPETFESLVTDLGATVVGHVRRRDHHVHTAAELSAVARAAEARGADLVTTEKDDVKLAGLATPRIVVELDLRFLGDAPDPEWLFVATRDEKAV